MTKSEFKSLVINVFEEYYRLVTLNSSYVYKPTQIDEKSVDNFVDFVNNTYGLNSIGVDWVIDYIELSFHWWYQKTHLKFGLSSIKLSWIVGVESIKRSINLDNRRFIATHFRKELRKDIGKSIRSKFKDKITLTSGVVTDWLIDAKFDDENQQKQLLYGKPEGLLWCASNTSMFNHKSELCEKCVNRLRCKQILKETMPKLYKARGYE